MASQTLKEKVLQTVSNLSDDSILQGLLDYIELASDHNSNFEFDNTQLQIVEDAKEQIKEGLTHSDSDVNNDIEVLLQKWMYACPKPYKIKII